MTPDHGDDDGADVERLDPADLSAEPVAMPDAPDVHEFVRLADPMGEGVRERAGQEGKLHIAAVAVAGEFIVPPILKVFCEQFPATEIIVKVGNRAKTLQRLLYGEADIAIGGRPPDGSGITGEAFLENQFIVVAPPEHPLAREDLVRPEALAAEPWLLREPRSGSRRVTEDYWIRAGIHPDRVMVLGSAGAVRQAAVLGLGLALVSGHSVATDLDQGRLVRLRAPESPVEGAWYALYLGRGRPFGTALELLSVLRSPQTRAVMDESFGPAARFLPGRQSTRA